jgi:acyl CoA:acetate/3-ketoacid CoA transferase alpha subunit
MQADSTSPDLHERAGNVLATRSTHNDHCVMIVTAPMAGIPAAVVVMAVTLHPDRVSTPARPLDQVVPAVDTASEQRASQ